MTKPPKTGFVTNSLFNAIQTYSGASRVGLRDIIYFHRITHMSEFCITLLPTHAVRYLAILVDISQDHLREEELLRDLKIHYRAVFMWYPASKSFYKAPFRHSFVKPFARPLTDEIRPHFVIASFGYSIIVQTQLWYSRGFFELHYRRMTTRVHYRRTQQGTQYR